MKFLQKLFNKEERKGGEKKEETLSLHEKFYLDALRDALKPQQTPPNPPEYASRIADLEIKMAKLWSALIEVTPQGKEKLTRYGKRFGGGLKEDYRR